MPRFMFPRLICGQNQLIQRAPLGVWLNWSKICPEKYLFFKKNYHESFFEHNGASGVFQYTVQCCMQLTYPHLSIYTFTNLLTCFMSIKFKNFLFISINLFSHCSYLKMIICSNLRSENVWSDPSKSFDSPSQS